VDIDDIVSFGADVLKGEMEKDGVYKTGDDITKTVRKLYDFFDGNKRSECSPKSVTDKSVGTKCKYCNTLYGGRETICKTCGAPVTAIPIKSSNPATNSLVFLLKGRLKNGLPEYKRMAKCFICNQSAIGLEINSFLGIGGSTRRTSSSQDAIVVCLWCLNDVISEILVEMK